jgi:hypothetical protein
LIQDKNGGIKRIRVVEMGNYEKTREGREQKERGKSQRKRE